jgi:hypothetical protein
MKKYLAVAVAAAAMIVPATAAAQTAVPFQGSVYVKYQEPTWVAVGWTCPTVYYCGSANIAGYGPAFWSFDAPNGPQPLSSTQTVPPPFSPSDCAEYDGTSTITLNDPPQNSTLILGETEIACSPGNSGNTFGFSHLVNGTNFGGHPLYSTGKWQVQKGSGTGQFSKITDGSGTDTLRDDGAILKAAWTGSVTEQ